ncbi:MAG: LysM peptidoglycan-binding domain-containing protein [Actinobacteria bacterium]|nr:LysM peptidoglycan-binding domain-containing protein [Actinomycetota bacterium]
MRRDDWRRYAAPAAFLLAATVAIVLVRSGMHAGGGKATSTTVPVLPRKHVVTTTTEQRAHAKTSTSTSTQQFWTVQAGDTYGVIATKSGVPVATLERLNPKVSSTSLFIGEKIRLR